MHSVIFMMSDTLGPPMPCDPLTAAAVGLQVAGSAVSAYGAESAGAAQQAQDNYVAAEDRIIGKNQAATGVAQGQEELRQMDYRLSKAQSAAAASGGGASDPTVVSIMGQLEQESQYRSQVSQYEGFEKQRQSNRDAALKIYEGDQAKQAGNIKAVGDLFSGASSLVSKYSPTGGSYGDTSGGAGDSPFQGDIPYG